MDSYKSKHKKFSMESDMDEICRLKKTLAETENNLTLAAQFGKQLLEQNGELEKQLELDRKTHNAEIEKLNQEIYSLNNNLRSTKLCVDNLTADIQVIENAKIKETQDLQAKYSSEISGLTSKLSSMQSVNDQLREELEVNKELVENLQQSIKQIDLHQSILNESSFNDADDSIQNQLLLLSTEKSTLESDLVSMKAKLSSCETKIKVLETSMKCLKEELEAKECKNTSYFNIIETKKCEIEELQQEIERLQQNAFDPTRKGNSIFAEVEDHRHYMEQKYVSLRHEFTNMKNHYELNKKQIAKMKTQIASLVSLRGSHGSTEYENQLENNLKTVRQQLSEMMMKVETLENEKKQRSNASEDTINQLSEPIGVGKVYKMMYQQSRDENEKLYNENVDLKFKKAYYYDQIIEVQKKNHSLDSQINTLQAEVIRLRVKVDEGSGDPKSPASSQEKVVKHKEVLPIAKQIQKENQIKLKEEEEDNKRKLEEQQKKLEKLSKEKWSRKMLTEEEFNKRPMVIDDSNKEGKKCVSMKETVVIHDESSTTETDLKDENTISSKLIHKKKYRKMDAPIVHVKEGENPAEDCKQM